MFVNYIFILYITLTISVSRHILATLGAGVVFGFSFAYMLLSVAKFGSVQDHYVGKEKYYFSILRKVGVLTVVRHYFLYK